MSEYRLKTVSYVKIIGIILVVLGHSFHEYPYNDGWPITLYWMLYSFRMPLFVFASGVVLSLSWRRRYTAGKLRTIPSFMRDKALRLLVPYFSIMAIVAVPRVLLNGFADDTITLSVGNFTGTDDLIIAIYWFLPFSFMLMCAGYLGLRAAAPRRAPSLFSILIVLSGILMLGHIGWGIRFFSFGEVCRLGIYFFLGMLYGYYKETVDRRVPWSSVPFWLLCTVCWLILSQFIGGTFSMLACALAGIMMVLSLVNVMVSHQIHILDYFEGSTYMIFLLSWFPGTAFQQILSHFVVLPWWIYSLLAFTGGVFLPVLVYRWLVLRPADTVFRRVLLFILGHKATCNADPTESPVRCFSRE